PRFRVDVRKLRLVGLVLREFLLMGGNFRAAMSRPCVYGVFSGRLGGLRPKETLCVGCLRCTVQYPSVVTIRRNPERAALGTELVSSSQAETILYEAHRGRVPVRGAGYRGRFGGDGWDGVWLDMSEIVRPTRDGIHGREFISTVVDIGSIPKYMAFDSEGELDGPGPRVVPVEVPFFFDVLPAGTEGVLPRVFGEAAERIGTLSLVVGSGPTGRAEVPLVTGPDHPGLANLPQSHSMIALDGWDPEAFRLLQARFPDSLLWVRIPADGDVLEPVEHGVPVVHLVADYRGRAGGRFVLDLIRSAHERLVRAGVREQVTLVGSGGMLMAEHVPKAIGCGLDAVGLDVAAWVALQCRIEQADGLVSRLDPPPGFSAEWGVQRLHNLARSWRDQLLEVLGAMGMREVRRLRGETGRLMFQDEAEREAFSGIRGYDL
ncbi:MAG TPA: glutamate synthase-related protein, partial [Acidimicrobiia bacterium]